MNKKADSPLMTIIVYLMAFALVLVVFSVIYGLGASHIEQQTVTADGRIDWEAGWIATTLLNTPYNETTFGAYLATIDLQEAEAQQAVEAFLRAAAARTQITEEELTIYITQDGALGCALYQHDSRRSGCGQDVSTVIGDTLRDGELLQRRGDTDRLIEHVDTAYTGGNAGWASTPGEPRGVIIVVVGGPP